MSTHCKLRMCEHSGYRMFTHCKHTMFAQHHLKNPLIYWGGIFEPFPKERSGGPARPLWRSPPARARLVEKIIQSKRYNENNCVLARPGRGARDSCPDLPASVSHSASQGETSPQLRFETKQGKMSLSCERLNFLGFDAYPWRTLPSLMACDLILLSDMMT